MRGVIAFASAKELAGSVRAVVRFSLEVFLGGLSVLHLPSPRTSRTNAAALRLVGGLLLAGALALNACGPADPGERAFEEAAASLQQPIQGGYKDTVDSAAVLIVRLSQGFAACSGSLIAPNVVLTAQHCVAPVPGNGQVTCGVTAFGSPYPANQLWVSTRPELTYDPGNYHQATEVLIPPGDSFTCGNDIAIIILGESIEASEAIPYTPRIDVPVSTGEEYDAIGFGQTSDGGNSGVRYRRDGLFAGCVADACPASYVAPTEWRGDTGICQGDSGGPALDLTGRVIGVVSRGAAGCDTPVYGHVYGWADWIKEGVKHGAALAGTEAPPWADGWPTDPAYDHPVGGPCATSIDCPSGLCFEGVCTRLCLPTAPCPEGYDCNLDAVCEPIPEPEEPPPPPKTGPQTITSCSLGKMDPTKPVPWAILPVGLGALLFLRRRRRSG